MKSVKIEQEVMFRMFRKVSRDPIHFEIHLYPLEILVTDTRIMQRLRFLSQLAGATVVYPGATHTRFAHSLGTMHLAGVYAQNLFSEPGKIRIVRLASLLHDAGHGPFSHQFDDAVYKRYGYKDGHDEFRKRLVLEKLPEEMLRVYECYNERMKRAIEEDLELTLGREISLEEGFKILAEKIVEVFEGEKTGSVEFNVIQGPLGADRLDFLLRDSYHSGVGHFAPMNVDRILRYSLVKQKDGKPILCYHVKVVDNIYSVLFSRFMMYKNVYFHKTARAADLMIQEILRYACDILDLKERLNNLEEFLKLTDHSILVELERCTDDSWEGREAKKLVERFKARDLWKMVLERPLTMPGKDPSTVSELYGRRLVDAIVENLEKVLRSGNVRDEDLEKIRDICNHKERYFKIDTPYRLTILHPEEFVQSNVFLYDPTSDDILSFEDYVRKNPTYQAFSNNILQIVRVYVTEDIRELLYRYRAIP